MDPITTVLIICGIGIAFVMVTLLGVWKLMDAATARVQQLYINALATPTPIKHRDCDAEMMQLVAEEQNRD